MIFYCNYYDSVLKSSSNKDIFESCANLINLDLSSFNTSNVISMNNIFSSCTNLQTINILNKNGTYDNILINALTDESANVTIGYKAETKAIAEAMKETAGNNKSKITLKQI